ncbi:MAG: hypothetical protein ACRC37_01615, partial [Lentisphaeria bacterium]
MKKFAICLATLLCVLSLSYLSNIENKQTHSHNCQINCSKTPSKSFTHKSISQNQIQTFFDKKKNDTNEIWVEENKQLLFHVENTWNFTDYCAIQGPVFYPSKGFLYLEKNLDQTINGNIFFYEEDFAYSIENGNIYRRNANEVICHRYSKAIASSIPQEDHPDNFFPNHNEQIPSFQSLPDATNVVYIDFRGKLAPHQGWPNIDALPFDNITYDKMKETWSVVAEAFAPYNINVTTDSTVFAAAPPTQRIQCIITKSEEIHPNSGGVAMLNSWGKNFVCWVFVAPGRNAGMAVAHEVGHTLTLQHHGRT